MRQMFREILQPYFPTILQVLLRRLQNSKTDTFTNKFTRFYHFVSNKADSSPSPLGADFFIEVCEGIQSGVFTPLYLTIILPTTLTLLRPQDRRLATLSLAKTLTRSEAFSQRYKKGWGFTVEALLKLLENPPLPPTSTSAGNDDLIQDHDADDMAFGVGFTQLQTIKKVTRDEWAEIRDVKLWVREWLRREDQRLGGAVGRMARERLEGQIREVFVGYLSG